MITLPTQFTGCDLSLSHPQHGTSMFDISIASHNSLQAIAWYTDTLLEATPIHEGTLCALFYTIYHKEAGPLSTPGQIPSASALGTTHFFESRLIQALRRWSQQINLAVANRRDPARRLDIPLKMAFPKKTKAHVHDLADLLVPVAAQANFGIVYATLRYQRIKYAIPAVQQSRDREHHEAWEIGYEGQLQKGAKGLLEARPASGASTNDVFAGRLQAGLAEHGWLVDMVTEVVGKRNIQVTCGRVESGQDDRRRVLSEWKTFPGPSLRGFPL